MEGCVASRDEGANLYPGHCGFEAHMCITGTTMFAAMGCPGAWLTLETPTSPHCLGGHKPRATFCQLHGQGQPQLLTMGCD